MKERDLTRKSLPRLPIHATLGVPEVWTWEKGTVTFRVLATSGEFEVIEVSKVLPVLSSVDVSRWLSRATELGETKLIREFRAWVRERFGRDFGK